MDTMDTDLMDIMDTTDPMDIGDTMERDPLMKKLQLLDQTLMLRPILIMDTAMDITDHTDTTGDTMERELLMLMRPQLQVQTLTLKQMLMPGMDTMDTDLMDITDTTDPMDIGDTTERDLLMKKLQLLDQTLMLRLILIMDTVMDITDHMDTTGDTMERELLMLMRPQLQDQTLMLRPILIMDTDTDTTDHTDTTG